MCRGENRCCGAERRGFVQDVAYFDAEAQDAEEKKTCWSGNQIPQTLRRQDGKWPCAINMPEVAANRYSGARSFSRKYLA